MEGGSGQVMNSGCEKKVSDEGTRWDGVWFMGQVRR